MKNWQLVPALVCLLVPSQLWSATQTLVQYHSQGGTSANFSVNAGTKYNVTLPNPVTAGNALVMVCYSASATGSVTASSSPANTWINGPTATDIATGTKLSMWYALNVTAGITVVSVSPQNSSARWQCAAYEFNNVATSAAADGSASNSTTSDPSAAMTAGTFTTTTSGDLLINSCFIDGVYASDQNPTSFAVGSNSGINWKFAATSLGWAVATEYGQQNAAATINPQMLQNTSAHFICVSQALKSATAGGTLAGMHIVGITSEDTANFPSSNVIHLQMPVAGNLVAVSYEGATNQVINSITSNPSPAGGWLQRSLSQPPTGQNAQFFAGENFSGSNNTMLTITQSVLTSTNTINLIDISGAATVPFDTQVTDSGGQGNNSDLTTASIVPSTSNGLVFGKLTVSGNTVGGITTAPIFTSCTFGTGEIGNDVPCDRNNGNGNYKNPNTSPVVFTWRFLDSVPVNGWGFAAVAFQAAAGSSAPAAPTGLQSIVQ